MRFTPKLLTFICLNVIIFPAFGQADLSYYLPSGVTFDDQIPEPSEVIGHEVGAWHISHDRLVNYMQAVAAASDRAELKIIGHTYEGRPQLNLIITSPANHKKLEAIKSDHAKLTDPAQSGSLDISNMPAVAYLGYSIHGNESSGSNVALLVAYYLTAGQGAYIDKLLEETVILLDPSFNPDGLNRFANYVNANKSFTNYTDPNTMELNEPWPGGRTNHYWFDLNRDWLFVQHPESQNRIRRFHEWNPNLLTDHHEMGSNSTFFFQPGITSRNNPNTPNEVYRLTHRLGEFHAKALDSIGSLYYTQESFDDYYFGKGSTYPDLNGAVGILFEQASSRGHARETDHGILTFPFTIKNQFNTSLSSLRGLNAMREEFLTHQRNFYKDALDEAQRNTNKALVFGSADAGRNRHLADILKKHGIEVYHAAKPVSINGQQLGKEEAYYVPLDNPKYRLIKTMFETNTSFQDSLFYAVSTWTLPLSFNIDFKYLAARDISGLKGDAFKPGDAATGEMIDGMSAYAYALRWTDYYAPKLLYALLKKGIVAKVANEPFQSGGKHFDRGTILIPVQRQPLSANSLYEQLNKLAEDTGIDIYNLKSGLDYTTVSLGSPTFDKLNRPKIAMLVGEGVRPYDAGEIWHLFDQRYKIDMAMIQTTDLDRVSLNKYTTLLMPNGWYSGLSASVGEKIKAWVKEGGTLIASQGALKTLNKWGISKFEFAKNDQSDSVKTRKYADISKWSGAQQIGGAIFNTRIDLTNPLFYGYQEEYLPVFRNTEDFLLKSARSYANPMIYTDSPLLSGYISEENLEKLKNTSALGVTSFGRGKVIGFADNMNFRAIWLGTNKAYMNAIFFGSELSNAMNR